MLPLYAFTLFVSAFLLFLIQPMVGKMILPTFGGTPAVWNTCMVFFQGALLAGYGYAHGSVGRLGVRRQAGLHLALLAAPLILSIPLIARVLPIAIDTSAVPTQQDYPILWLLGRLILGVGLPFFVISTNAPVLQMWFSQTGHPSAKDPYFLYGASNLGSLLALLGYPLLIEPWLAVDEQSVLWAWLYGLFVVLAGACAFAMWRAPVQEPVGHPVKAEAAKAQKQFMADNEHLTAGRRLYWVALAFVPSSLMLGVTTHVTTEIAPVPLLWVFPLALYLLTFVLVFARKPLLPHVWMKRVFPFIIALVVIMTMQFESGLGITEVPLHLLAFFAAAMVCHGELAKDRPSTAHLTQFYLLMSVGGVLGGLFNAAVAPMVFSTIVEYPLVMLAACFVLAGRPTLKNLRFRVRDLAKPLLAPAVLILFLILRYHYAYTHRILFDLDWIYLFLLPIALSAIWLRRPFRFAVSLALIIITFAVWNDLISQQTLYIGRNFYGVKAVSTSPNNQLHTFSHGTTIHGAQLTAPGLQRVTLTYFHAHGPVGDIIRHCNLPRSDGRRPNIGVLGLGAGTLAAYAWKDQIIDFYEIDPEVYRIAADPALFTYLENCEGQWQVILGDGRLTLADAPDHYYGLLFLDAFSSDAVPTHLLTREALDLYLSKLTPDGVLIFNISNRYLDLAPLLGNLAAERDLVCLRRTDMNPILKPEERGKYSTDYVIMSPSDETFRKIRTIRIKNVLQWTEVPPDPKVPIWTDRYSNVIRLLKPIHF